MEVKGKQNQMVTQTSICHKIKRALTITFPTQIPYKHLHLHNSSIRSSTISTHPHSQNMVQINQTSRAIPIEYSHTILVQNGKNIIKQNHVEVEGKATANVNTKLKVTTSYESDNGMNERFSEYIDRAKKTIVKTNSNVGTGQMTNLGNVNKKASAYIDKTRKRFGSFGVESFKKRDQM